MKKACREYLAGLSENDCRRMLMVAIERLIECEEVRFHEKDDEFLGDADESNVYWEGSGDNLLDD